MSNKTLDYYDQNAKAFIQGTIAVDDIYTFPYFCVFKMKEYLKNAAPHQNS